MRTEIHSTNLILTDELRRHVERRLRFALGRFSGSIVSAVVRLRDENGPRGGRDKVCQVVLRLNPSGTVAVKDTQTDLQKAIDLAADRSGRAAGRELSRRREGRSRNAGA
jgi:ribosomal subunit interface protein